MTKLPNRLSEKVIALVILGVKQCGSYEPDDVLISVEEMMTVREAQQATAFLRWVTDRGLTFGHGNIDQRYAEFLKEEGR